MSSQNYSELSLAYSQHHLQRAIGILGILLPFILVLGNMIFQGFGIKSSISGYYYTAVRNVFVGCMFAVAICLFTYRGYERKDRIAGIFASFFAVCIALCPTTPENGSTPRDEIIGMAHGGCGAAFFITLSIISIVLFTKTYPNKTSEKTKRKKIRNGIYIGLGVLMLVCVILMILVSVVPPIKELAKQFYHTVLVLEFIAVEAFGFSWLIKGETLWKDVTDCLDATAPVKISV